jgi:hypothetical protein
MASGPAVSGSLLQTVFTRYFVRGEPEWGGRIHKNSALYSMQVQMENAKRLLKAATCCLSTCFLQLHFIVFVAAS